MFSTIKGGEKAIDASHKLLKKQRRGNTEVPELEVDAIREQLGLAVDRVMAEGSLYSPELAALAIKQAQGDLVEAAYLLRAYRATLPRIGESRPVETTAMTVNRRLSTTYKNVPGGQLLGATYDYTHRLLDFSLANVGGDDESDRVAHQGTALVTSDAPQPNSHLIESDCEDCDDHAADITRNPLSFPMSRDGRLQALARGDEGFLSGLAYSTMRGYGRAHPFLSNMKVGSLTVEFEIPEVGETVTIGEIELTEVEILNKRVGSGEKDDQPRFIKGYGLAFGRSERKAMAMAILDFTLRTRELGDEPAYPAQDEEFVLSHSDNIDASGLVQHLKLPHYVDFQAEVQSLTELRDRAALKEEEPQDDEGVI
jgi:alpha-D-ribose 1-methylphosphonate 5-triphosphate synthase subunit PhnI